MKPLLVYHNPRCRKSREALQWLEAHNVPHQVRLYLKDPLSEDELRRLIEKLRDPVEALVRTNEKEFKSHFKGVELTPEAVVAMIRRFPRLMQRPVVENEEAALVARPADRIAELLG